jgi:membrane-associated protein
MDVLIDFFLNLDAHLTDIVAQYGPWVYAFLFAIVFAETGLVVTPFLPGDSLLFAAGAIAATGAMDIRLLLILLTIAAILGDAVNYAIGRATGPRIFRSVDRTSLLHRALNRDHLQRAHEFFEKYGGKAVILARFVPIVRTFVPFVAGAGAMTYSKFALYNVVGGIAWVVICTAAGYAFGTVPVVKENFELVVIGIIAVSLIPIVVEWLKVRKKAQAPPASRVASD